MTKSHSILSQDVIKEVQRIGEVDFLVGIPSFGDIDTISHVMTTAGEGLARYFPGLKAVIVNSYGDPEKYPSTSEAALKAPIPKGIDRIVTHYQGISGKGSAFRTIFEIADRLNARICITLDADLRNMTPRWIKLLADPVYKFNFGFVTPLYFRHKYDGTITNNLAYPLTRALYGLRVRQPIGGEFGFTGELAKIFSHQSVWDTDIAKFGIDVWMTTTAITAGFRISQASMGVKLHDPKDPSTDLGPMFSQVVGTLFQLMGSNEVKWQAINGSVPVYRYGGESEQREIKMKEESSINLVKKFVVGFQDYRHFYKKYLRVPLYRKLADLAEGSSRGFILPEDLWAKTVYDIAIAYNFSGEEKELVVNSLIPLYYGRTASFMNEVEGMSPVMVEALIEGQARVFEEYKSYLRDRWDKAKKKAQSDQDKA